jgi:hypothetical protein
MTRFAAHHEERDSWVSYEGCSAVACGSPTNALAGARSSGPAGCMTAWRSSYVRAEKTLRWWAKPATRTTSGASSEDAAPQTIVCVWRCTPSWWPSLTTPTTPTPCRCGCKASRSATLSREDARRYQPGLLALEQQHGKPIALAGAIVGGGIQADGPGRLGVFLDHDPADFGLRPMAPPRSSGSAMRTGLSDAVATDEADDSYDLSWMGDMPADDLRAIKMLRQLLEHESDAIDRHFMHAHLEALLSSE